MGESFRERLCSRGVYTLPYKARDVKHLSLVFQLCELLFLKWCVVMRDLTLRMFVERIGGNVGWDCMLVSGVYV